MDIHKPKPWHGAREFLKEYLIIVIGVLTALAAEQGVEWWRWRERVGAAEVQVARELSASRAWADERVAVTPCLDRRLAALEDRLLATGSWTPLPAMVHPQIGATVYVTPFRNWPAEVWRSLAADGTVGHLDRARQVGLGGAYIQVGQLDQQQRQEDSEIGELSLLARPLDLDRAQRLAFARLIERERWRVRMMSSLSSQISARIPRLVKVVNLPGVTLDKSGTWQACRALGLLKADLGG